VAKTLIPFLIIEVFFSVNPIGWVAGIARVSVVPPPVARWQQSSPDAELSEFPYDQRAKILEGDNRMHPQLPSPAGA
jgi:hypothetical protein